MLPSQSKEDNRESSKDRTHVSRSDHRNQSRSTRYACYGTPQTLKEQPGRKVGFFV